MSDSRLEKFIYAICSMDVSDLPVPLSRIEKLWNCLITGETPDFEPLSRNEKYLMAMLGLYELNQLPTPMSRGEKLLYKIAMSETDLSDVPGYLSRYEELLKYLIENGGIGFEYVLYTLNQSLSTLYQTVEKPVKSAILKGCTLTNLAKTTSHNFSQGRTPSYDLLQPLKINTTYTVVINVVSLDASELRLRFGKNKDNYVTYKTITEKGLYKFTMKPSVDFNHFSPFIPSSDFDNRLFAEYNDLMIIEGNYTNVDIPYFEGMQSVKMPVLTTVGKNLFDVNELISLTGEHVNINKLSEGEYSIQTEQTTAWESQNIHTTLKLKKGEKIYFHGAIKNIMNARVYKNNFNTEVAWFNPTSVPTDYLDFELSYTATEDCTVIFRFWMNGMDAIGYIKNVMIEIGNIKTAYEPYKSNILTVNEEVELRGIGDVKDELNCLTGEVVKRTHMLTLPKGLTWEINSMNETNWEFIARVSYDNKTIPTPYPSNTTSKTMMVDTMFDGAKKVSLADYSPNKNTLSIYVQYEPQNIPSHALTLDAFKNYVDTKTHTLIYKKNENSVKTVDLTTVNQDGQPTKLKTFNDITYVEMSADNIIPSVDVEVATKISETLATLDPQQLDISNTQNKLGQTINEQTENTDATMMATTEIYEQTL